MGSTTVVICCRASCIACFLSFLSLEVSFLGFPLSCLILLLGSFVHWKGGVKGVEQQKIVQGLLKQEFEEFLLLQAVGCARNYNRREKKIEQDLHIFQLLKPFAAPLGKSFIQLAPISMQLLSRKENRSALAQLIDNAFPVKTTAVRHGVRVCPRALNLHSVKPETKPSTTHFIFKANKITQLKRLNENSMN